MSKNSINNMPEDPSGMGSGFLSYTEPAVEPEYFKYIHPCDLSHIKEVILHIGMKPGVSSIQETLYSARDELLSQGYYYPHDWNPNHVYQLAAFISKDIYNFLPYRENGMTNDEIALFQKTTIENLVLALQNKIINKVIFSFEEMNDFEPIEVESLRTFIQKLFGPATKVSIVMITQNPVNLNVSWRQQLLKNLGQILPIGTISASYHNSLQKYLDIFSGANFILYKFEDSMMHPDGPIGFFLDKIGYSKNARSAINYTKSNASMSQELVELLTYINIKAPYYNNYNQFCGINKEQGRTLFDSHLLDGLPGPMLGPSEYEEHYIFTQTYDDTLWLKETTGLDYISTQPPTSFEDDFITQLKTVFPSLTPRIKELVNQYLVVCNTETIGD